MSLSAAGILSAAAGAIPNNAVGLSPYSFRVKVIDGVATEVVQDLLLEAAPSAYGRVPEFLLDNRLYNLVGRYLLDTVDRAKVELHFFRPFLAALSETFVHLDRDILCEAWGGSDESLRDVLDDLKVAGDAAVKTIENIAPDALGNFDLVPGAGISFSPQPSGVMISASSPANIIDILKSEAAVPPGGTVTLNLSTDEFLAQAWVKVNGVYYKTGNIPDTVAKHLDVDVNSTRSPPGTARMAMCVGSDGVRPVVHAVGSFTPAGLEISRFDGLTMTLEETMLLSANISAPFYEPLVLSGRDTLGNLKVVVFWVELNASLDLMYAELVPANYASAPIILPLTPLLPLATQARPLPQDGAANVARLTGVIGSNGCAYVACMSDPGVPLQQIIIEVQVGSGPVPALAYTAPVFATATTCLDMIYDNMRRALYWLVAAREFPAANGPMELYQVTGFPGPMVVAGPLLIDNTAPRGLDYRAAGLSMNAGDPAPANNHIGITVIKKQAGPPDLEVLTHWTVSGIGNPFPAGATSVPQGPLGINVVGPAYQSRFAKDWNINSTVDCRVAFIEPQMRQDGYAVQRTYINPAGKMGATEQLMYFPRLKAWDNLPLAVDESYVWTRVAETQANVSNPDGYAGRVLVSLEDQHCYSSLDPSLKELITIDFDPVTKILTGRNNSSFTWDIAIVAEESSNLPPENLLIPCYQFAQAMKNYFDATGWYPSPSVAAGVLWTEAQVAGTPTGGFTFSTYYSVTPGQYDLHAGSVAQAWYMADEPATTALDYTLVFRYNYTPTVIQSAEAVIKAAIDAFLLATPPLPHGTGLNPNYYTLPELDAILGTTFAATYSGAPYDYYRYFLFTDLPGLNYVHGWYSANFVDTGIAYGPHPSSSTTIPVSEHFTVTVPGVANVSDFFVLANSVAAARVYVNGIMYIEGIDWQFVGMNTIEYFNRMPGGYVLSAAPGDVVTVEKYQL